MAVYNKFDCFVEDIHNKVHNLASDSLKITFTNSAPDADLWTQLSEVTGALDMTNAGATNTLVVTSSVETAGTYALIANDLDIVATGDLDAGALFRYAVLYNSTATNGELIAWFDYTTSISLLNAETFTLDFDPTGLFTTT